MPMADRELLEKWIWMEKTPMAIVTPPLPDRIEKVFAPYAREVGKLVASWNQLQERLGELFSVIVRKDHAGIALAIWYSTRSDLAQRQMLRASSEAAAAAGLFPEQAKKDDIKWLLDRTDELPNNGTMPSTHPLRSLPIRTARD